MRTHLPSYRHSYLEDIESELPMLITGAVLLSVTVTAIYLYAASL